MTDDRDAAAPRPTGLDWTPTVLPPKTVILPSRIVLPGIDKPLAPPTEVPDVTELVPADAAAIVADPEAAASAALVEAQRAAQAVGATLAPPVAPAVRAHPPALAEVMAQSTAQAAVFRAPAAAARGRNRAASASIGFGVLALVMLIVSVIGGYRAGTDDVGGWVALFLLAGVPCLVSFIAALVGLARPPRGGAAIGLLLSIVANPLLWAILGGAFG